MKPQLLEILRFLRNPGEFLDNRSRIPAGKGLLYAWANEINILLYFLLIYVIISVIEKWSGFDLFNFFPEREKFDFALDLKLFLLLIWAPIFEEAAFRGFLNLKKEYVWISVMLLTYAFQKVCFSWLPEISSPIYFLLSVAAHALIGIGLAKVFEKGTNKFVERYLRPNFSILVYISFISFGLAHITNFEIVNEKQYLLAPLLTIPQLISGVFLCYIRINYGLLFSIALHFSNNFFTVIPGLPAKFDKPYLAAPIFILIIYLIRKLWKNTKTLEQIT